MARERAREEKEGEQAREQKEREQAREEEEREKGREEEKAREKLEGGYSALNWSSMWRAKEAVSESIRISQAASESSPPDWASSNKAACSSV
jgi:hypothetical protein